MQDEISYGVSVDDYPGFEATISNMDKAAAAARRGARRVTRQRQVVVDAEHEATAVLARRLLGGAGDIADPEGFCYRVAANAARRLAARRSRMRELTRVPERELCARPAGGSSHASRGVGELRAQLARLQEVLTPKQRRLAAVLAEPGMSLHRAARELGMDRANLRRMFRRILLALEKRGGGPPPSSSR